MARTWMVEATVTMAVKVTVEVEAPTADEAEEKVIDHDLALEEVLGAIQVDHVKWHDVEIDWTRPAEAVA